MDFRAKYSKSRTNQIELLNKKGSTKCTSLFYLSFWNNYNPKAAFTLSTKSNFSQVNNSTVTVFSSPFGVLKVFVTVSGVLWAVFQNNIPCTVYISNNRLNGEKSHIIGSPMIHIDRITLQLFSVKNTIPP